MTHTPEQIKETIEHISEYPDDQLVFEYKVLSSKSLKKEKELYKPLLDAIIKERKKRGTTTVTSKVDGVKKPNVEWEN